jgi:hypothetical protein
MKREIIDRAHSLKMEYGPYLKRLVERDLSGSDLDESEKPRFKEFSQRIGLEISRNINEQLEKMYVKQREREMRNLAGIASIYRIALRLLYIFGNRLRFIIDVLKISSSDLQKSEEESKKNYNNSFQIFFEDLLQQSPETLYENLRKPV